MARLSATSSAVDGNGHVKEPTTVPIPVEETASLEQVDKTLDKSQGSRSSTHEEDDDELPDPSSDHYPVSHDPTLLPGGSRDLAFIALQAFALGTLFAASIAFIIYGLAVHSPWWRLPAFSLSLSIFHFLEYYTTAAYNTPACRASSFLLFNNGRAYTMANLLAATEIIVSNFFPRYQELLSHPVTIAVGLALVVVGQVVRSVAMKQASTNFNHIVQHERKETHVLVTQGVYSFSRHPSYFGFFWWSIGTQLLVANKICLFGFVLILWRFFSKRIKVEEKHLIQFFGDDYKNFRKRTGTKIPFIA